MLQASRSPARSAIERYPAGLHLVERLTANEAACVLSGKKLNGSRLRQIVAWGSVVMAPKERRRATVVQGSSWRERRGNPLVERGSTVDQPVGRRQRLEIGELGRSGSLARRRTVGKAE
jgi:hypothetical protein